MTSHAQKVAKLIELIGEGPVNALLTQATEKAGDAISKGHAVREAGVTVSLSPDAGGGGAGTPTPPAAPAAPAGGSGAGTAGEGGAYSDPQPTPPVEGTPAPAAPPAEAPPGTEAAGEGATPPAPAAEVVAVPQGLDLMGTLSQLTGAVEALAARLTQQEQLATQAVKEAGTAQAQQVQSLQQRLKALEGDLPSALAGGYRASQAADNPPTGEAIKEVQAKPVTPAEAVVNFGASLVGLTPSPE